MTTLPIETRTASDDLPLEKALVSAMAEEMGKSHVWDQGYESMLPSERHQKAPKTAAWKPPTLTKALARTVAKRLDKHWAQTGVKGLGSISHAIAQGVLGGMSQMRDRVDNQAAVKKWSEALSKDDLHKMFRMIEEIKNGKGREQYRMTDDALSGLRAASDLLPVEKAAASYLDTFFKEKRVPSKVFDVTDRQGITHSIPNQVVIDMIKQTRGRERSSIEDTLRKIDYGNGDVNHFLAHLAKGLAESYSGALRLASEQEAEKLQAEAEANEQQANADRAKAEAAQMREASSYQARDVDRKLRDISESLIEDDYVFILDPRKKLNPRRLMKEIQEDLATELSDRSVTPRNPGGDMINAKDIDLDVEWSEDIDDGIPGWGVSFSGRGNRWASREAAGGLYGYTKGTQNDVEASVRKAQRRAASVAKVLYAKDERSVDFLKAHVKRANSKSARLILSAMKDIGPRVASDKTARLEVWEVLRQMSTSQNTALDELDADLSRAGLEVAPDGNKMTLTIKGPAAKIKKVMDATRYKVMRVFPESGKTAAGSGAANAKYLDSLPPQKKSKILKHLANHYGVSVSEIEDEVKDSDAENLFEYTAADRAMTREIYNDFKRQRLFASKTAAMLPSERHASIFQGSEKEQLEYVIDALRLAGNQGLRVDSLPRKGALAAQEKGLVEAERGQLFISSKGKSVRLASEKVAGGLYGHPTKTARLALVACSDLRAYVGEVAYSLHSRRTAKYAKVTGFLKEHGKTSKCAYSRMILDCYPDGPASKQAKEKYPWDECIADQMKQYDGDKETAEKVCGKIKSQGKSAASEMLKKAFVPDSVDGWVEWVTSGRTFFAHKEA